MFDNERQKANTKQATTRESKHDCWLYGDFTSRFVSRLFDFPKQTIVSEIVDLLNAIKTLLAAYQREFEQNQALQDDILKLKQENGTIEQTRNRVEADLLRIREAHNKQMLKNEESAKMIRNIESKFTEIRLQLSHVSEEEQAAGVHRKYLHELLNLDFANLNLEPEPSIQEPISCPSPRSSPESFAVLDAPVSEVARRSTQSTANRVHMFELAKNKLRFNPCQICKSIIMPLINYYRCVKCDNEICKNCYETNAISMCVRKVSRTIRLEDMLTGEKLNNVPIILVKCCELIELRESEAYQDDYTQYTRLLDRWLVVDDHNEIKAHKHNAVTLCTMVVEFFKRLNKPLISTSKWNDFTRACGKKTDFLSQN